MLEDDTLGGGGSRGSGKVRFAAMSLTWRGRRFYAEGADQTELVKGASLGDLQKAVTASDFAGQLAG